MVRPRARSILLVVLGVVIGFAVGSGATLTLVDAWFSGRTDPDPEDIAAAGRLQAALEQAGQEQTLLIGPSVRENPAGSGDYELSATLPDDTGLEEVLTIFDGVEATVEQADVGMGDKGRLSLAWTVGGERMGAEVGLSGTSTGTLRTGLTTALAAVQAGAERANVAMRNSPKAVEVDWGEAEAAGLSAARPGQEQNPAGDAIMYSQTAWVDRVQVRIETEPGARSLIETDIAGWVTAAKDAGFTDVRLRASDSGIWRSFRVSDARSSSDVEAVAPPLLAAIDRCDVSTGTELSTGQQYGNDAARLEYDCRDGWLAVAEEFADENTRETTDPEAAQRALDAARR